MTSEPSGRLYTAITKHWPRIATALVVVLGLVELVAGGLTADSGVEFYLMAWAGTTGGLWFLFEKAEKALSDESRESAVALVGALDIRPSIESIPSQFATLFDRVFGVKHLSWRCFWRSSLASLSATGIAVAFTIATGQWAGSWHEEFGSFGLVLQAAILSMFFALPANAILDFLSLVETRWMIGMIRRTGRFRSLLALDLLATLAIWGVPISLASQLVVGRWDWTFWLVPYGMAVMPFVEPSLVQPPGSAILQVSMMTSLFTSVWLWIYALSVPLSRVLLRMNSGVGFLLRVTDVERQPFRSMGFVSVVIVSAVFALGLPFVLL